MALNCGTLQELADRLGCATGTAVLMCFRFEVLTPARRSGKGWHGTLADWEIELRGNLFRGTQVR